MKAVIVGYGLCKFRGRRDKKRQTGQAKRLL
nr:MAG TPA: Protein of unknown function (DUF1638) [Caudoviricetes sp.]